MALTLFVLPFSFAIAVFKDVPDAEGDRRFRIGTFTVRLGARAAFRMGMAALVAGYLGMAVGGPLLIDDASGWVLAVGHLGCLAVLLWLARRRQSSMIRRASPASTCGSGPCSSSSTCSCPWPSWSTDRSA